MLNLDISLWLIAAVATCIKLLLMPCYRSTDFEVHRNWMAITYNLPLSRWYREDKSQWTLDYPPFFAWLEFALSQVAIRIDPQMVDINNFNYDSPATVYFQRISVIVSDLVYIIAVNEYCKTFSLSKNAYKNTDTANNKKSVLAILLLGNFGLFIVDHIHFQYNGLLFGLMLLSITSIIHGNYLFSAFWFSLLLNFKHIYIYIAPAYFVYLLKYYCFQQYTPRGRVVWKSFSFFHLVTLSATVISVFGASFGPFILMGELGQVLSRLFPFKRGLCHAYWAPNFWAVYNLADKLLTFIGTKSGFITNVPPGSMTSGLVQEYDHTVLPRITPSLTLAMTALSILPALIHLWLKPKEKNCFVRCIILCAFGSFLFGWHVHEKAILLIVIPLTLLVTESIHEARISSILSITGHYSLFPLVLTLPEWLPKVCLLSLYVMFTFVFLKRFYVKENVLGEILSTLECLYLSGIVLIESYCVFGHKLLGLHETLPFLPLMLISCYCSIGVLYCWLMFYHHCVKSSWSVAINKKRS